MSDEEALRATVREAIATTSVKKVSVALGLSSEATSRLAGGLPVQRGTVAVAAQNLDKLPKAAG